MSDAFLADIDFLPALIGCMRAGVIACSAYPPNPMKLKTDLPVFLRKAKDAGAKYALTTAAFQRILRFKMLTVPSSITKEHNVQFITTETCFKKNTLTVEEELSHSISDIAFIQYTSGSTSFPKGVMISHKCLIENAYFIRDSSNRNHPDEPMFGKVVVSWVPQYHDFGLIVNFMACLAVGTKSVSFSPIDFIANPLLWHRMIIDHQASFTPAPNFAYGLVAKRLCEARSKTVPPKFIADIVHKKWDRVQCACFGGEPTDPKVLDSTIDVLGVRPECIANGYGMAETGMSICDGFAEVLDGVVDCGERISKYSVIQIVDNGGNIVPDGTVGEIWAQTKMIAAGYWNQPELSQQTFKNTLPGHDGYWLATGDLGKVVDGRLYVTGRKKEMIIINARNFFPVDLERTLESEFPAIRPGCNVAFQYTNSSVGITAELRKGTGKKGGDSIPDPETIRRKISETHKVPIAYVCLLHDHTVPKTTSGKLRRIQTREISQQHGWKAKSIIAFVKIDEDVAEGGGVTEQEGVIGVDGATNGTDGESTLVKRNGVPFEPTDEDELSKDPVCMLQRCFRANTGKHVDPNQPIEELGLASLEIAAVHSSILEAFDMDADDFPIMSLFDGDRTLSQIAQELAFDGKSLSPPHDASSPETWDEGGDEYDENDNDTAKDVPFNLGTTQPFLSSFRSVLLQTVAVLIVPLLVTIASYPAAACVTHVTTVDLPSMSSGTALLVIVLCLPLVTILNTIAFTTVLVVMKWLLVGKQQQVNNGRPVWGVAFAGRWIVRQYARFCWTFTQWAWLNNTELLCVLHRCLGCTIGKNVKLTAGMIEDFDLVTIGSGSSVSGLLNTETVQHGKQLLGSIEIGSNCSVAGHSQIDQRSKLADSVVIKEQTMVPRGSVLEADTVWQGLPAKQLAEARKDTVNQMTEEGEVDLNNQENMSKTTTSPLIGSNKTSKPTQRSFAAFRLFIVLVVSPYILVVEAGTAIDLGYLLWTHGGMWVFGALVWALPTASLVVSIGISVSMKRLLLGRIEEGRWPVYGQFYRNKWFVDHLVQQHMFLWQRIARLFGSPFALMVICQRAILNMLGANIGAIPTVDLSMYLCYDLLTIGGGTFIGGGASIDVFEEYDGFLHGRRVSLGKSAYAGTRATLVPGATLEDGAAIAAYSITNETIPSGRVCIGGNVFRAVSTSKRDGEANTSQVKDETISALVACLFAMTGAAFMTWLTIVPVQKITENFVSGPFIDAAVFVVTYTALTCLVIPLHGFTTSVISKCCLAPSIKEGSHIYGSSWRLRGIIAWTLLMNKMNRSWIVGAVGGTWMEVGIYRLLGAKIGKNAYVDCIWLFEPDLVHIGDGVAINKFCCVSPHNYKIHSAEFVECLIGDGCVIGTNSTFSGSSRMEDGAELDSFSMALRGAVLTAGRWVGYPAMLQTDKGRGRSKKAKEVDV